MKKVKLYGHLGARFGREFEFDVQSPAEAVCALKANLEGFSDYMMKHSAPGYRVIVGKEVVQHITHLSMIAGQTVIKIVPVVQGAGGKMGAIGIILGVALMVVAPQLTPLIMSTQMAGIVGSMGLSLVLGGVASLLSDSSGPSMGSNERPENAPSYMFNGVVNTSRAGGPVPVLFGGPMVIGSHVISASLRSEEIPFVPPEPVPPTIFENVDIRRLGEDGPFEITVWNAQGFQADGGVSWSSFGDEPVWTGLVYTPSETPGTGEYHYTAAGVYTFPSSLGNANVRIAYTSLSTGQGSGE